MDRSCETRQSRIGSGVSFRKRRAPTTTLNGYFSADWRADFFATEKGVGESTPDIVVGRLAISTFLVKGVD